MAKRLTTKLLENYDSEASKYLVWTNKLELLVKEILTSNGIHIHSVTSRVKDRRNLERKIDGKQRNHYSTLEDITDIAGVRIITHFSDDVDRVAELIRNEFVLDLDCCIDKRNELGPDTFGYLSLHYIVSLNEERSHLAEYKRLMGLKAEIQIRSVLQHAWAEIEHDLGYKTEEAIPKTLRRRFSRLASLLELGDEEFVQIRDSLKKYKTEVHQSILRAPQNVSIDKDSLRSFLETSLCRRFDIIVAKAARTPIYRPHSSEENTEYADLVVEESLSTLQLLEFTTIGQIEEGLKEIESLLPKFVSQWCSDDPLSDGPFEIEIDDIRLDHCTWFSAGVCLHYLALIKLAQKDNPVLYERYFKINEYDVGPSERLYKELKEAYALISQG